MATYFGLHRNFEPGILDRNHRAVGFWGLMLVAVGIAMLAFVVIGIVPD